MKPVVTPIMAAITMRYLKITVRSWIGKHRSLTSWILSWIASHQVRQITETRLTSSFKMMALLRVFLFINQIISQVWSILICYDQAPLHLQVAEIAFS